MIKRIVIRDVASYDHEGIVLDNLQKVNFIYGGNGTGKTTISRFLNTSLPKEEYSLCKVEWEGVPAKVYVYNKDFRENSLKEKMPGVFTLIDGDMMNESRRMEELRISDVSRDAKVLLANLDLQKAEREYKQVKSALHDEMWEKIYKPVRDLKELLKGNNRKASFAEHIRQTLKKLRADGSLENTTGDSLDIDGVRKYYKETFESNDVIIIYEPKVGHLIYTREVLEQMLWLNLVRQSVGMVDRAEHELMRLDKEIKAAKKIYQSAVNNYKKDASTEITEETFFSSVQPSLETINLILRQHGFTGFSIQPSPESYNEFQIQREDGSYVQDTLSEGEATIISFLYFMQIVEGRLRNEHAERATVVIDDPISSLDYDAIDLVSTLSNNLIKKARRGRAVAENEKTAETMRNFSGWVEQVIVLTHNASFHKSVSMNQSKKSTHYWKLYKRNGVSRVKAFETNNPVRGDYEELWAKLKDERDEGRSIEMPNLMRRIIDTYFLGFGGYDKCMLAAGEYVKHHTDKTAVTTLMKCLDEGSHGVTDSMVAAGNSELYMKRFETFWKAMGHDAHYRMMMGER